MEAYLTEHKNTIFMYMKEAEGHNLCSLARKHDSFLNYTMVILTPKLAKHIGEYWWVKTTQIKMKSM